MRKKSIIEEMIPIQREYNNTMIKLATLLHDNFVEACIFVPQEGKEDFCMLCGIAKILHN